MRKILHFVSKMDRAGQETFLMNVFRNINRSKVKFGFLCTLSSSGDYDQEIRKLGGEIHYDPIKVSGHFKIIENFFILKETLKKLKPNYQVFEIHTQHAMDAYLSALAAKKAGFNNVIVHSHNSSTLYHPKLHLIFKPFLKGLKIHRFACSDSAGKWMYGNSNFQIIKNGINLSDFIYSKSTRQDVRKQLKWENSIVIGHVGRFNAQKNQLFLIDIFAQFLRIHPNAKLVFVGDGDDKVKITRKIEEMGLEDKVVLLGVREDTNRIYQGMDAFVFPSLFEGLPVVLVEAQAASLPCLVSSNVTKEIKITDKIKFMNLKLSDSEWAKSLDNLLEFNGDRVDETNNMIRSGYDIKVVANRLERIYLSLPSA